MGLLSALFSGPSKSQIDLKIRSYQSELAGAKSQLAAMTPKMKKEQPQTVRNLTCFIENRKMEIDHLKAQRKNAK